MSGYRINQTNIKTIDDGPKAKGGQGTVVIGTLLTPEDLVTRLGEEFVTRLPERIIKRFLEISYAIKKLDWDREDSEESVKFFKVSRVSLDIARHSSNCSPPVVRPRAQSYGGALSP